MDARIIEMEALGLPDEERAQLADRLLSSLSPVSEEIRQSWIAEVKERFDAFQHDEIEVADGPSAMAALKSKFGR